MYSPACSSSQDDIHTEPPPRHPDLVFVTQIFFCSFQNSKERSSLTVLRTMENKKCLSQRKETIALLELGSPRILEQLPKRQKKRPHEFSHIHLPPTNFSSAVLLVLPSTFLPPQWLTRHPISPMTEPQTGPVFLTWAVSSRGIFSSNSVQRCLTCVDPTNLYKQLSC